MKKYSIFLVISLILSLTAFGEIKAPEWSDFCPEEYLKASNTNADKNEAYWYTRRAQFNNSLRACKVYQGRELKRCYDDIVSKEEEKNSKWSAMANPYGEALERGREKSEAYNSNFNPMSYGATGLMNAIQQGL